ncbi:phosphodiester glycosidase family protein [Clostridium estertheticum]|uniref:phosphodiester glycosidase family protein n=1 Tax=Clostridium estertheticum TaxID=238834 RepID=UPI00124BEEAE|nr:phosphodiester glycosidase family protein [Clostridium estertheticum]MBU3075912.1 phosphodiester glycosidase family protein [Clostridium estertheticum]MBU3165874.1 phosphodiester glycosidase family protein [Clostridium estertheticum]MBU3172911.1 phosphodiester glycosidase family protein [Clostridium estertheticum]MBZ9616073.1 phosphodiester glycosidase family protein [Clostridium estertheticum subsp. laramiense]WAG75935.1 phosphodiester glycosidase family protein [Clostridium estertheticum]
MRKIKKRRKTKKRTSTLVLLFVVFELIFTTVTGPFMLYYGPFKNVKSTVVGAAMTTYSLQWLATTFLSKEAIAKIMSDQTVDTLVQKNLDGVKVENKNDNSIERYDVKGNKFKGYILIINDPTRLKVGSSSMLGKEGQLTSDIAKDNNAIAAINGGGFNDGDSGTKNTGIGTGGNPTGIIMGRGKIERNDITDVDKKTEVVAMTNSGKLLVGPHSLSEMRKEGVTDAVSFGPALIVGGEKTIKSGDGGWGIAPRTCVAQRKDGAIIFLVIDGRQLGSVGATLREAQDVLYDYGAVNASNLDGGSSSTLFYDDEVINSPSDSLGERTVPSIMYIESRK